MSISNPNGNPNSTAQNVEPNPYIDRGKTGLRDNTYEPKRPRYDITTRNAQTAKPGLFYGVTNI